MKWNYICMWHSSNLYFFYSSEVFLFLFRCLVVVIAALYVGNRFLLSTPWEFTRIRTEASTNIHVQSVALDSKTNISLKLIWSVNIKQKNSNISVVSVISHSQGQTAWKYTSGLFIRTPELAEHICLSIDLTE